MADPGDVVYPTITQLRAIGTWVQTAGLVTGLSYRDADDAYDLISGATLYFSITEPSAIEQNVLPEDRTIEIRVPPVSAAGCDEDCDWAGVSIIRSNNIGIYGPNDALNHTSWVPSDGNITTPNTLGEFTVSDVGTSLLLTLPSDYENRLDEVPLLTAPVGPPTIYWFRRANIWYPTRPLNEARYCWLGWERLSIPITAPDSDNLTLTIKWREYTFTDNHLSDSTRSTTFSYEYTEYTEDIEFSVDAGYQVKDLEIIAVTASSTPDGYPRFERVVSVELSGFGNGAWVIGEPELRQSSPSQILMKAFEGSVELYRHGGLSIHADAAFEWYDANENNALHDNIIELTVRFFDYLEGAGTGLDLTVAYQLDAICDIVDQVSEVFTCSRYDTGYYAAVRDEDLNILSTCWGFNICYPNADTPPTTEPPILEQNIGSDTANCSLRCGAWTIVSGTKYLMLTDKVVDVRYHGRSLSAGALSRSQVGVTKLWRRGISSTWSLVETLDSDAFGHIHTTSLRRWEDYPDTVYSYGTGPDADNVTTLLLPGDREYAILSAFRDGEIFICRDHFNAIIRATCVGQEVRIHVRDGIEGSYGALVGSISASGNPTDPWVAKQGGLLLVGWKDSDGANLMLSYDNGESFFEPPT